MPNIATIVVEKQPCGAWNARFAQSNRFHGEAAWPGSAVSRLIDCFGWEKIDVNAIVEVGDLKLDDYRVFRAPLNALGLAAIHFG